MGALVGAGLFEFSRSLFELYILNLANYQVVYGALASLPIFLLWIYLSWMVALLGAEVVAVLQQRAVLFTKAAGVRKLNELWGHR